MKKTLLYIVISIIFLSCQKINFDVGEYEMTMKWSDTYNGETKDYESTRNITILSETKNIIEIQSNSSLYWTKDGNKIYGDLPPYLDITSIEGHKTPFTNTIKGTFTTIKYVTQGPSGAPALKYEYSGKFKKKKI